MSKQTLTPEEIRSIRESLGLSQVEAGDLLGGGPRAFTKYEAGAIKPAQSVINLLRLLEANPGALNTLSGKKSVPISTSGRGPLEVTGEHVQAVTERTFAVLVRKLLAAEAQSEGLPTDNVHVAGSITTPDAGEDGRISWSDGPERTRFLPARLTQLQLKAGKITPSAAAADVVTKAGAVKPMISDAISQGGVYVMLSAHPYVQKDIQEREERIRAALRGAGVHVADHQVAFRDADQIAEWINRHPSVATWLLEHTQPGLIGPFRSWSHWAGRAEHDGSPWVEDIRLSEIGPQIRASATVPQEVSRVLGASGVGKSRLVLDALEPTDEEEVTGRYVSDLALYADEGEAGPAAIKSTVQNLADAGARAIIVVDRCSPDSHGDLSNIVRRQGSQLSLLTIDDGVPDDPLPKNTLRIGEAPDALIEGIINNVTPGLPSEDQRRLVRFSRGFPKIASLVAQSWSENLPIARATDENLVDNVLLGRNPRNPERTRKVAELLASFIWVLADGDGQELARIAELGDGVTEADIRATIDELGRRGIAQRRGRAVMMQPRPIALHLAERQWRRWSPEKWDDILGGTVSGELRVRAARQLALLDRTEIGQRVVRHACRFDGPFATAELIATGSNAQILSSLAEVDGEIVVRLLERALDGVDFTGLTGDVRRHLVWGLEKIAFHPSTFEEAANLLLRLSLAENETYGNNATGQFTSLFPVLLGNTAADPPQRLAFLDEISDTDSLPQRLLVVDALLAGAKTGHFSRGVGAETHGTKPALESWHPQTWGEAWDYVKECVSRLIEIAKGGDDAAIKARTGLGQEFRSLVNGGLLDVVEWAVEEILTAHSYWPEALESLGDVITYDSDGMDGVDVVRVRTLIEKLQPTDDIERVRFLVTEMPWDWPVDEKLGFDERGVRQVAVVKDLATELLQKPDVLRIVIPQLCEGRQRMSAAFGEAIAEQAQQPLAWLKPIKEALTAADAEDRNYNLLAGYLAGIAPTLRDAIGQFKNEAAVSEDFGPALPLITWRLGIVEDDIPLVISALKSGVLPPGHLVQWTLGGVLARLEPAAVAPLFDVMFTYNAEAFSVGVDLLGMYVHGTSARLEHLRPQLRAAAENAARWPRSRVTQLDAHHFKHVIDWLLQKGRSDPDAAAVALILARSLAASVDRDTEKFVEPLLPRLLSEFPEIVWPLVGQAIVSDRVRSWRFEHLLGDKYTFGRESNPALLQLPEATLFAWCHAHPDAAPAFAAKVVPVLTSKDGHPTLHPVMRRLIDEFGDRNDVLSSLDSNIHSFSWSGSRATYYAQYEQPLGNLFDHPNWKVRRWAKRALQRLRSQIDSAHNEDAEREVEWE